MSRDRIILHVGAHRTGTTSLQTALDEASGALARNGILALTPPRRGKRNVASIRDAIRRAPKPRAAGNPLKTWVATRLARRDFRRVLEASGTSNIEEGRQLILSDEMMLGPAFDKRGHALYPEAALRLGFLRKAFLQDVAEVHLTVRSYETFLVSCYAMRAVYAGRIPPFDDLRETLVNFEAGWPELVQALASVFPEAQLKLSVFEETTVADRVRALLPDDAWHLLAASASISNKAPTTEAIAHARKLHRRPLDPDRIVEEHAGGTAYDPLAADEKSRLRERYRSDLVELRNHEHFTYMLETPY